MKTIYGLQLGSKTPGSTVVKIKIRHIQISMWHSCPPDIFLFQNLHNIMEEEVVSTPVSEETEAVVETEVVEEAAPVEEEAVEEVAAEEETSEEEAVEVA